MIPLTDTIKPRSRPIVNYLLMIVCGIVFLLQLEDPLTPSAGMIERYGMIPFRVLHPEVDLPMTTRLGTPVPGLNGQTPDSSFPAILTLLTCIFLHGGWLHFLGNMLFLHVFGDNVEDCFGHLGYLLFYVGTGLLAGIAHLMSMPNSIIPTIGASGAIAGIMGGYFVLYPHSRIYTLIPAFVVFFTVLLPAQVFLGIWILFQLVQGSFTAGGAEASGVAWWAHIGGFMAGYLITKVLLQSGVIRQPIPEVRYGRYES